MKKDTTGIALIAVIMLITIVSVTVGGVASFVANNLALSATRAVRGKALYAAQAGVYYAIYACRNSYAGDWRKRRDVELEQNLTYSYGVDANFLQVWASAPILVNMFTSGPPGPGNFGVVEHTSLWNNSTETITMNRMKFDWYNVSDPSFVLRGITLNLQKDLGRMESGQMIDLDPPFTMGPNSGASNVRLFFSKSVPTDIILIATYYFTDGSSRKAILRTNSRSGNGEVSITATGKVGGNPGCKRTIEATYDSSVNMITSWREIETHI